MLVSPDRKTEDIISGIVQKYSLMKAMKEKTNQYLYWQSDPYRILCRTWRFHAVIVLRLPQRRELSAKLTEGVKDEVSSLWFILVRITCIFTPSVTAIAVTPPSSEGGFGGRHLTKQLCDVMLNIEREAHPIDGAPLTKDYKSNRLSLVRWGGYFFLYTVTTRVITAIITSVYVNRAS